MNVFELIKEKLEEYQENNTQNKSSDDYELGLFNACDYAIDVIDEVEQEYNKRYEPARDLLEFGIDGYNLHLKERYIKGYNQGTIDRADEIQKAREYGYNKGIDEFAERLKRKAEEIMKNPDIMLDCKKCTIWKVEDINEIAEHLKGGSDKPQ